MKKLISIILILIILVVGLVGCGDTQEPQQPQEPEQTQEQEKGEEKPPVSVSKSGMRMDWGDYYVYSITGTATNKSDTYFSQVVITFTVYDDVDVAMKKLSTTISGLAPNETKEYYCSFRVPKTQGRTPAKSEITDITYK